MNLDVIGVKEESIKYIYDESVFLVQEVDCVRAITFQSMEIIQKVPQAVRDIFRINSTAPGSFLLEASKQFKVTFTSFTKEYYWFSLKIYSAWF